MDPLETLRKKIDDYKAQLGQHLLAGGAKSHEEYCRCVGKAEAFEYLLSDISEIEKRHLEE